MSLLERLYETYQRCEGREPDGGEKLMPICHTVQQAQIEIILNDRGEFRRALVVPLEDSATLMPATEASAGRSGQRPVHHPLCDKLQYVAGDFVAFGGVVTSGFSSDPGVPYRDYVNGLSAWSSSEFTHLKVAAILSYVQRGQVIRDLVGDLVSEKVLHLDVDGCLLNRWEGGKTAAPAIFRVLGQRSQHDALVRWRVETFGDPVSATWDDARLQEAWISYCDSQQTVAGFCMVTGRVSSLATQHPKRLRNAGDQAKLISSNDTSGYTFRGRFLNADEAASVGFEVSQKAHNALRWLIGRQAYRDGGQVFLAWSPDGASVPDPMLNTARFFGDDDEADRPADVAEAFARRLNRKIAGYKVILGERDDVIVLGLDSATPGRVAITYYRSLTASEFLARLETWHTRYSWYQNVGGSWGRFIGVAAPKQIAEAAYGPNVDEKLRRATVERLMPCIIDLMPVPRDLVQSTVRRASGRAGLPAWDWEKTLGVACGLYRGFHLERNYQMTLETDRTTRDYLYGRLLAVADSIERRALALAGENRSTNAERLMQRFADRPFTTWRTIELSLRPYIARLRSSERGRPFLFTREALLQDIKDAFDAENFTDDSPLSGEFLLSFDVQRRSLFGGRSDRSEHADPPPVNAVSEELSSSADH